MIEAVEIEVMNGVVLGAALHEQDGRSARRRRVDRSRKFPRLTAVPIGHPEQTVRTHAKLGELRGLHCPKRVAPIDAPVHAHPVFDVRTNVGRPKELALIETMRSEHDRNTQEWTITRSKHVVVAGMVVPDTRPRAFRADGKFHVVREPPVRGVEREQLGAIRQLRRPRERGILPVVRAGVSIVKPRLVDVVTPHDEALGDARRTSVDDHPAHTPNQRHMRFRHGPEPKDHGRFGKYEARDSSNPVHRRSSAESERRT